MEGVMENIDSSDVFIASLTVLRELYDQEHDVYDVIIQFALQVINQKKIYTFTANQITNHINDEMEFTLPQPVVTIALNRMGLVKKNGFYQISPSEAKTKEPEIFNRQVASVTEDIASRLISFIEKRKKRELLQKEKEEIIKSFCKYLLDENAEIEFSGDIFEFIIQNQDERIFVDQISKIREGIILYSGIKYSSDVSEIGSWKNELVIFLDTEILFDLAGYNGEIFESSFNDLFGFIKEINAKAKKPIISLRYFRETTEEVKNFFSSAESIIGNQGFIASPENVAMRSIISGCSTKSDVVVKQNFFKDKLKKLNILEFSQLDITKEENHEFNLFDKKFFTDETIKEFPDISSTLQLLTYVNILRGRLEQKGFENSKYVFLTRNKATIKIANSSEIRPQHTVPLATYTDWIINRFWFKLNKGFGKGNFPSTLSILTKAQISLSTMMNQSISEKYQAIRDQYNRGQLPREVVLESIADLKSKTCKPENITKDNVSSINNFISEEDVEQFLQTIDQRNEEFTKQKKRLAEETEENESLRRALEKSVALNHLYKTIELKDKEKKKMKLKVQ
jgi:hypothetical protein